MARYVNVPINFVGGESKSRSRFWSSQSSVNFYVDVQSSGRTESALMPWPGEKAWSAGSSATNSGLYSTSTGDLYTVNDSILYSVDINGVRTSLGSLTSSSVYSFADDGANLLIATGRSTVTYLNNRFIFTGLGDLFIYNGTSLSVVSTPTITSKQWAASNSGDPTTFPIANIGSFESSGDNILQAFAFQQRVYFAGEKSIEVFYNPPDATSPPLTRIEQSVTNTLGAASPYTYAASTDFLYHLGNDGVVYRTSSYQPQPITPSSISKEITSGVYSDAFAFVCRLQGIPFYVLQLPSAGLTLAYSERSNEWTRLSSGVSLGRHLVNGYAYAFDKHLVSDYNSSAIYEWDFDTHQSNANPLIRQRDGAPVNGISLGASGERLIMNKMTIIMETGVGNTDIPNPKIMVSGSYDGGRSFTNEDWIEIGRQGESVKRIDWYNMGTFYDFVPRVRVSDPAFIALHGASIELKRAGL